MERVAPTPVAPPSAIAIVGYRDPTELDDLGGQLAIHRRAGLFDANADTVRRDGPAATARAALAHVARAAQPIWLHVDLDVLDEEVFPATDYLIPGGLDWNELVELLRDGSVVDTGSAMASVGAPGRGTYEIGLGSLEPGSYAVRVVELSAEDGRKVSAETTMPFTVRGARPPSEVSPTMPG